MLVFDQLPTINATFLQKDSYNSYVGLFYVFVRFCHLIFNGDTIFYYHLMLWSVKDFGLLCIQGAFLCPPRNKQR